MVIKPLLVQIHINPKFKERQENVMKKSYKSHIWLFFGAVYVISACLAAPILLSRQGMSNLVNKLLMLLYTFVPSITGIVFVSFTYNHKTRRDFWHRVVSIPRVYPGVLMMTLCCVPMLNVAAFLLSAWLTGTPYRLEYAGAMLTQLPLLVEFLLVEFFLGGGFRGTRVAWICPGPAAKTLFCAGIQPDPGCYLGILAHTRLFYPWIKPV